jgi:hypothetical protein
MVQCFDAHVQLTSLQSASHTTLIHSDFIPQNRVVFSGLTAMHSYEVRVRAKTAINDDFGEWSTSAYVKLTDSPPLLVATIIDFVLSTYNDRIFVNWTAEANPKQADRYYTYMRMRRMHVWIRIMYVRACKYIHTHIQECYRFYVKRGRSVYVCTCVCTYIYIYIYIYTCNI